MKALSLTIHTQIVASQTALMSELAGEAIILEPASGTYYGLSNQVGIRIWQLIQQPTNIGRVWDAILAEYEVEPEQCRGDVLELLQELVDHNLAEICHESAG